MIHNLVDSQGKQELLNWYDVITKQNYFLNNINITIQNDGLTMGAPPSSILAKLFLQYIENSHLTHLTQKHKLVNYFRYVDDKLLIFDPNHTDIHAILADFNSIYVHPKLHFTAETEQNNALNYLDVTIHKTSANIKISIYRKTTFTDTLFPYTSNNPMRHKYAAVRFLYNRPNSYQLHDEEYQNEENI